ncbi:uncharacterized protein B4U79_17874 [Dinothrombium tinctorium]|uniref:Chitin-binding type-2 domain-containing protein n=1 Tax=Dinothrombium tinctorium TaxID=1965070 RepID=A0A443RLZ9_9ACAR|nr:uncharacterized protein B4U79_17874 [Dinothrombium tinctorium]
MLQQVDKKFYWLSIAFYLINRIYCVSTLDTSNRPPRELELNVVDETESSESDFSCFEKTIGYYAEVKANCKQFHLCYPEKEENSENLTFHRVSFACDVGQVFDQRELICVHASNSSIRCEDSPKYYDESSDTVADLLLKSAPQYFVEFICFLSTF